MKRALNLLSILGIAALLAGCDKCGNAVRFFPGNTPPPASCTTDTPQG